FYVEYDCVVVFAYAIVSLIFPVFSPVFFFFNDSTPTEISTLSLHDALPICADVIDLCRRARGSPGSSRGEVPRHAALWRRRVRGDRKSTRLNSSHDQISYAVFCLKKKKKTKHSVRSTKRLHRDCQVTDRTSR